MSAVRPFIACLCAGILSFAPWAQGDGHRTEQACHVLFASGLVPVQTESWDVDICKTVDGRPAFAVRFDTRRQIPDFVAYKLTPDQLSALTTRKRPRFRPDAALPAHVQAQDSSYTFSGYSRGHMVPAHDMSWSAQAYKATFDFSNAVPQRQWFNAGSWLGLEDSVRAMVRRNGTALWTITGVYGVNPDQPTIGTGAHTPTVPACFFKILIAPGEDAAHKVLAVVLRFDDQGKRRDWSTGITTLAIIRERTGIPFLDGMAIAPHVDAPFWGVPSRETPADCV